MDVHLATVRQELRDVKQELAQLEEDCKSGAFEAEQKAFCDKFSELQERNTTIYGRQNTMCFVHTFDTGDILAQARTRLAALPTECSVKYCPTLKAKIDKELTVSRDALTEVCKIMEAANTEVDGLHLESVTERKRIIAADIVAEKGLQNEMKELSNHRLGSILLDDHRIVDLHNAPVPLNFQLRPVEDVGRELKDKIRARLNEAEENVAALERIHDGLQAYRPGMTLRTDSSVPRVADIPPCPEYLLRQLNLKKRKSVPRAVMGVFSGIAYFCLKPEKKVLEWLRENSQASDPWMAMLKNLDGKTLDIGIGLRSRTSMPSVFTGSMADIPKQECLMRCAYETCLMRCLVKEDEPKKESKAKRSRAD